MSIPYQGSLFQQSFEEYLSADIHGRQDLTTPLQEAIAKTGVTTDEEIAHCLARIVTAARNKPYFEYRDFVPRQKGSLVAEAEEAPYFRAILKIIAQGANAKAVAFLIDEFEEIGLQKRLTRRAAHDYLATLKRLINLAESADVDFWLVLSMTPDAHRITRAIEPALDERFSERVLRIEPLSRDDAEALMASRLDAARPAHSHDTDGRLFPFPDDVVFNENTYSRPRRLVKTCFFAIAEADDGTSLPFSAGYLRKIEAKLYPDSIDRNGRS